MELIEIRIKHRYMGLTLAFATHATLATSTIQLLWYRRHDTLQCLTLGRLLGGQPPINRSRVLPNHLENPKPGMN